MKEQLVPELRFHEFEGEWEEKKLGEILEFKNGINAPAEDYGTGIKFINVLDILENKYITYENIIGKVNIDDKKLKENEVNYGDILFQRSSETKEEVGMSNVYLDNRVATFGGFVIRGKKISKYDPMFMNLVLRTDYVRKQMEKSAGGSTRFNIGQNELRKIKYIDPSISEQQKIGAFFYKIDKKLELQQEKIENLKKYKKGMMQRIFSQEIRFKDDNGNDYPDWEEKKLGEISKESIIKYKDYNKFDELLSVTLHDGIKKQSELGERDISSENKSNYKVVHKNNLVYNSMRMWQGASGISKYNGIVSSAYVVINMLGNINPEFIGYYFKQSEVIHKFYKKSQGMTSDTLTLKYNLFKDVIISIPIKEEQTKIANFLSSIDKKIELEEEKLEEYKKFKKGLMQRMFI